MMTSFVDLPLQRKLSYIVLLAIFVALSSSITVVLIFYYNQSKQNLSQELRALASITAQRSTAALLFADKRAVTENLQSLMLKSSVETTCVFDKNNQLFVVVDHQDTQRTSCDTEYIEPGAYFDNDKIIVNQSINVRGKDIGRLAIISTIDPIKQALWRFVSVALAAVITAFLFAYLVTTKLTHSISKPIGELTQLTQKIRRTGDYGLRGKSQSNDETGQLIQHFNDMVSKIQLADIQMDQLVTELKERSDSNQAEAQKMTQRHDAIRDFFSGVTHDLRQPLQAIDMYVNVLQSEADETQRRAIYQKLHAAVSNLGNMFRELLDVSRFEARVDHAANFETIAVGELLEGLCHEFDALAQDKGLSLRLHVSDVEVMSDRTMLSRVIRNLVSNAIRYTEKGGLLVAVRPRRDSVWIEVWDTGRGIREDKQTEIFNQFTQVKSEDAQKGHGLGLAIVKRLVSALGHELELTSIPGQGTRFRIAIAHTIKEEPAAKNLIQTTAIDIPGTAETLMLVDDDPQILDALTSLLQGWDFNVLAFQHASQVKDWIRKSDNQSDARIPALIISDFHLGDGVDGVELITELKQHWLETPAFIVSSTDCEKDINKIKAAGLKRLPKPIKPAKLRALINYYLTQR